MMETPLTLDKLLDRAVSLFGDRELVTKRADESLHRYTYADADIEIASDRGTNTDPGTN